MAKPDKATRRRERLAALVDEVGSKAAIARRLGFADGSYVGQLISGNRPITEETIEKIESVWPGWFDAASPSVLHALPPVNQRSTELTIKQFDTGGSMGRGVVLRDQPGVIRSWQVTPEWIQKNVRGYSSTQNLCIVTGFGDSMRPMFNPGDPLLVDTGVRSIEFDAIYFFRVGEEGFLKRLQRIPGEGVVAISENKAYREWTIKDEMQFEVYGRVLKVWRGEDF